MTLKAFFFIVLSALFHVMWNSTLKMCKDKPAAVFLMMIVTVGCFGTAILLYYPIQELFIPSAMATALAAGFFFFLYQYFVAIAYESGDLTLAYPLTVTGPVYIALWSYLLIDEQITVIGAMGIFLIIYGAITLQTENFMILSKSNFSKLMGNAKSGVLPALAAAFFYSFGAVADKLGVMTGNIMVYTFHLSLYMLIFHIIRILSGKQTRNVMVEMRQNPVIVLFGGIVMLLSFITFRIGLVEALASYASALRQVSTLFGIVIGFFIFKESVTLKRIFSSVIIVAGAVLIKLG